MVEKSLGWKNDAQQRRGPGPGARRPVGEGARLIYIDSSCLVKIFRSEPGSAAVIQAIAQQALVIVTPLVELEVLVQLKADYLAGDLSRARWRQLEAQFFVLR